MAVPWRLLLTTFNEWREDNIFTLAASLAFYTIFSLSPILLISVEIAGFIFSKQEARQQIIQQVRVLAGPQGGKAVAQVLNSLGAPGGSWPAIFLGVLAILVGSTAVFANLQGALNQVWDVKPDPRQSMLQSLLRSRLRSFALVLTVGFLLLLSLTFSAILSAVQAHFSALIPGGTLLWRFADFLISFIIIAVLFAMIYRYLPDVQITWQDVGIGAVVTAFLFSLGKSLISLYLGKSAFVSTYGAAGSFVVMLLWIYYSALISFLGAEFTQVYARRYGSGIRPESHAVRLGRKPDTA
jgi:membrane protein